jgi:hypothetical protein
MKTTKTLITTAALLALGAFGPAQAVSFIGASTQDGTVVNDYSALGLVSFDIDFRSLAPATLNFAISAEDLSMPLSWNAILRNLAGTGFDAYVVNLSLGSFASAGSVNRQFGGSTTVEWAAGVATIGFTPQEFLDIEVGNALGTTPAAIDWKLGGLAAGDTLALTVTPVPEPGTWGLMAAGLGLVGWLARRRSAGRG